jgi:hypothetical protein
LADIRSSQVVAQVEWQKPGVVKVFQVVAQVEYTETPLGEYNGDLIIEVTPGSEYSADYVYTGDVSVALTPESSYSPGNEFPYDGDVSVTITPSSDVIVAFCYTGDVTIELEPNSDVVGSHSYEGVCTIFLEPVSVSSIPIPGFDWFFGYGLVDLTFLGGEPPYYCEEGEIIGTLTLEGIDEPYKQLTLAASGGISLQGEVEAIFSVPPIYIAEALGGWAASGDGVEVSILPSVYTVVGEGGVKVSGAGNFVFVEVPEIPEYAVIGSGGYDFGGQGVFVFVDILPVFTLVGFGGYKLSGVGVATFEDPEIVEYAVAGSGGYKLGGEGDFVYVTPDKVFSLVGAGELLFSGVSKIAWFDPDYFSVVGSGGVVISGEGTDEEFIYFTWVFSGVDYKPSVYSGYDFNSYCSFGGKNYGANEKGIFELAGETDDGIDIHTGLVLGPHDLGIVNRKRLRTVRLGNKNKAAKVRVELDATSRDFSIVDRKANITRDLIGEELTLTLADFEEISVVELTPVVMDSRG